LTQPRERNTGLAIGDSRSARTLEYLQKVQVHSKYRKMVPKSYRISGILERRHFRLKHVDMEICCGQFGCLGPQYAEWDPDFLLKYELFRTMLRAPANVASGIRHSEIIRGLVS